MIQEVRHLTINMDIDEEGLIEISIDELQGCFASGETIEQACANLAEALYLWLESQDTIHFGIIRNGVAYFGNLDS